MGNDADLNPAAEGEHTQLFQFFESLQRLGRLPREVQQELAPVGVWPQMLQESRRTGRKVWLPIADKRDRRAAEIQRMSESVAHHFDAIGIVPLLATCD